VSRSKAEPSAPTPEAEIPDCPEWIHEQGRELWQTICPQLAALGYLARSDREALARYCHSWGRWRDLERYIAEHGSTYQTASKDGPGRILARPEVREAADLERVLGRLESQFGMTPAARAGIAVPVCRTTKRTNDSDEAAKKLHLLSS